MVAARFLQLHAALAPGAAPTLAFLQSGAAPTAAMGWWAWWDQGLYQKAAVAWANGVTDPGLHWYLPGYSMLGAAFVRVTPADPFLVPNLACLIGTLWLFCRIADRLLDGMPLRVPLACCVFVACTALPDLVLRAWVVPWTTTPETLCLYAALLGALRLMEGGRRRDAVLTGMAAFAVAGFRPADAAVVVAVAAAVTLPVLLRRRMLRPSLVAAAACGALVPALLFGGAYLAVWGPQLSGYLQLSKQFGFEPRLLALRWVTLMVDPRPLYPDGAGLATTFFWIMPGMAGIAATLVAARGGARPAHLLVGGAILADLLLFMMYRDLHPTGLWRFENYHYFKWMLPLFALYALRLLPIAMRRDGRRPAALAAGCLVVPLLFLWRAEAVRIGPLPAGDGVAVTIPGGLSPINATVLVPASGAGAATAIEGYAVTADGLTLRTGLNFVIYNAGGLLRMVPVRPMPAMETVVHLQRDTPVVLEGPPVLARQSLWWGVPFWVSQRLRGAAANAD